MNSFSLVFIYFWKSVQAGTDWGLKNAQNFLTTVLFYLYLIYIKNSLQVSNISTWSKHFTLILFQEWKKKNLKMFMLSQIYALKSVINFYELIKNFFDAFSWLLTSLLNFWIINEIVHYVLDIDGSRLMKSGNFWGWWAVLEVGLLSQDHKVSIFFLFQDKD